MRIAAFCCLSIVASCTRPDGVAGTYSGAAFLTVSATPVPGTTATAVRDIVCAGTLRIENDADGRLRGTFDRGACTGLVNPTEDVRGSVGGALDPDGRAMLTFTAAPFSSSAALTTSGACPPAVYP